MNALQLILQTYLNKFSNTTKLINDTINNNCKQIVIIPSYCEPELEKTLNSLLDCEPTKFITEVIIVFNCALGDEEAKHFHQSQKKELEQNGKYIEYKYSNPVDYLKFVHELTNDERK